MTTAALALQPYIFFYGRCEEALEFYKKALGGTYEAHRMADSPMAADLPPGSENRIMHATFTAPGFTFFASDGRDVKSVNPDEGNISLSLSASDESEGERAFNALAEGGTVTMPLEPAFWGGRFGMIHDRFGVEWMMTVGAPE